MTDDAGTSHLLHLSHGVGNHPMAADELNGIRSFIRNANRVKKKPLVLIGVRPAGIILSFDVDPEVSCNGFG